MKQNSLRRSLRTLASVVVCALASVSAACTMFSGTKPDDRTPARESSVDWDTIPTEFTSPEARTAFLNLRAVRQMADVQSVSYELVSPDRPDRVYRVAYRRNGGAVRIEQLRNGARASAYVLLNGNAWCWRSKKGSVWEKADADMLKSNAFCRDSFLDYAATAARVSLESVSPDGRNVLLVLVRPKYGEGIRQRLTSDPAGNILRIETEVLTAAKPGDEAVSMPLMTVNLSAFRDFSGKILAAECETLADGAHYRNQMRDVRFNTELADALFRPEPAEVKPSAPGPKVEQQTNKITPRSQHE